MTERENTITLEELRRRQLSRLRNETPSSTTDLLPDESFNSAYQRACAEAENGGWPVPDRIEWETEHKAWLEKQKNRKQPENKPEPTPFQVGQATGEWYPRAALPRPRWPEPGATLTRDVVKSYDAEHDLYQRANRALQDIIHWTWTRLNEPEFWEATDRNADIQSRYAETWAWLMGIWQGRKIQPPTETQIEVWARDWDKKQTRPTKAGHTEQSDDDEKESP